MTQTKRHFATDSESTEVGLGADAQVSGPPTDPSKPLMFQRPVGLLRQKWPLCLAVAVAAAAWTVLHTLSFAWLSNAHDLSMDGSWRLLSRLQEERRIVLIDVDERSLQEVGQWPWPRATQAKLIERLAEQGVALQALDIVFVSADSKEQGGAQSSQGNDLLGRALAKHQPVLAQVFALPGQGGQTVSGVLQGPLDWPGCGQPFMRASGYLANHQSVLNGALSHKLSAGHITPQVSADGVIRRQPAVICYQDKAYPALAVATAAQASAQPSWSLQRGTAWADPAWSLVSDQSGLPPVPLDQQGNILIPWWLKPNSFISISAADVLNGHVPQSLLRGAWALVGSSAFGLNDSVATPFLGTAAGMLVHAELMSGLLDARIPYQPRLGPALELLLIFLSLASIGVVTRKTQLEAGAQVQDRGARFVWGGQWLAGRIPLQAIPVLAVLWACLFWALHLALLHALGWVIEWIAPALAIFSAALVWAGAEHTRTRRQRTRLYEHLSSYLPAPVAASLALQPPSSSIRASTHVVSVLFADVRNFSAYCESRPAQEAAAVLHAYFTVAARVVAQHGGVIESFQGDAVVAVWGESEASSAAGHGASGHAAKALAAAVELHQAMKGVLPDPAPAGLEPLALGVGVESGPAMVGSFGMSSRRTHMVMGRTVTIASRLVGMTSELAHPVLVGEGLAAMVPPERLRSLGTFMLEGLSVPHHIYASVDAVPSDLLQDEPYSVLARSQVIKQMMGN